jgi:YidC/Oxa1 family membrane protein insertase
MEKNTLLAVILSVVVISAFFVYQSYTAPKPEPVQQTAEAAPPPVEAPGLPPEQPVLSEPEILPAGGEAAGEAPEPGPQTEQRVTVEIPGKTGEPMVRVVLTNAGGDIVSWKLLEHRDGDDSVEMVLSGEKEAHAFTVAFGGLGAQPVGSYFYVNRPSDYSVEFYRDFVIPASASAGGENGRFRLTKRYNFKPQEYMFELTLTLDGGYSVPGFNFSGAAYTLSFGPQIGPQFEKLDGRYEYRNYLTYVNGKRRSEKVNENKPEIISTRPSWAAIAGKYFALIAVPSLTQYDLNFSTKDEPGLPAASRLNIIRQPLNTSRVEDTYRFYLGPKNQDVLAAYNNGGNAYGLNDMQLINVANSNGLLSPLEKILKWFLRLFYKLIPNYGIAILLLTLLVKVVFFPLTKKGSEATLRMQGIAPKIKELQTKYKDNPQRMNAEMAELYKKEGYNPLSGCLPMLLQIPIFFAMYNLFNNHFDLRGAMFIPRWIPDLSLPEAVYTFSNFRIPLLGWNAIRLLPFIYVGSQLLYGRVTQTPDQQGNAQMKMMLYVMPIMFFFILYDVPSGLLIYWIFSNILTMVQQLVINKYLAPKRAAQAAQTAEPVIAPKRKKRK